MDDEATFIDSDGNEISCEDISSHIGLAMKMIDEDPNLKNEFLKSGKDPVSFMTLDKGYLARGTMGNSYRNISYLASKISEKQKKIIEYYRGKGYEIKDFTEELRELQDCERE